MATIKEILIYTYQLTFNNEIDYDWMAIAEIMVVSDKVEVELYAQKLLTKNESKENLRYWQDLFFMEVAEQGVNIKGDDDILYEKIKNNSMFKDNEKFIIQLPKVTTDLGRELLIDTIIENENADKLIPEHLIENVLKKKSREDLRKDFGDWNAETIPESITASYVNNRKSFKLVKFLIAACVVGVIVTIGYNTVNKDKVSFEDNNYVTTSEKSILEDNGLGYVDNVSPSSIVIQILNYEDAIADDYQRSEELVLNSYSFFNKKLKLVLPNDEIDIKIIKLNENDFYISLNNKLFSIETSKKFKRLEGLNNKDIADQLNRILFEDE